MSGIFKFLLHLLCNPLQIMHTSTLRKSRSIPVHLTVAGEEESSALPFRLRPEAYRGYTEHDTDCELIQEVSLIFEFAAIIVSGVNKIYTL